MKKYLITVYDFPAATKLKSINIETKAISEKRLKSSIKRLHWFLEDADIQAKIKNVEL